MSWEVVLQVIGAVAALGLAIWKAWWWLKGKKEAEREAFMRSAERLAEASRKVTDEARKTAQAVESVGPDTLTKVANKLLSGTYDETDSKL